MKNIMTGLIKFIVASALVGSLVACGGAEERKVKYLEKGKVYLEEENYEKAKIEFKNVLQIDPKFSEAYYFMGQLNEKKKELGKALGSYKKAIELDSDHSKAKIKLAKIYVIIGSVDYIDMAKKLLSEVEAVQSGGVEVKLVLATIAYKTDEKLKAKKILENVVKEDSSLVEGISLLSTIYLFEGDESKALKLLKKGAKDNPKNIYLRISLAKLLAKNKKLIEAEKYLKQAIKIKPEKYALQVALSSFYASSGQIDKAELVLREAIEQDSEDVQRYLILVKLLSARVSIERANDELDKAILKHPDFYELKFAQVSFFKKTGRSAKAKSVLKKVIKDRTYDVEGVSARNLLAKILFEEGDHQGAKKYVEEVIVEYPSNNDALLIMGKLALVNLDAVSAINGLRTVLKNDPKNAEASYLLAQAHELNNESSLAENELKKAIEANSVNDQVHVNYARYLGSKGRIDEALNVVDKALSYFKESYELMSIKLKILASSGKEAEMVSLLELMEQTNPNNADANINKGKYYLAKGRVLEGIEEFEKAYQKSQDKFTALKLIVQTYVANNQLDKALTRLQENIEINKKDAISTLLIGQVYLMQKKLPEAREQFVHASSLAETWFIPYSSLAGSYLAEKKVDKALSVYQGALSKLIDKTPAQMKIAAIYEGKKNYSAAMEVYENILSEKPGNKLAENNFASLLLDYGKNTDAQKALDLVKDFEKLPQAPLKDTLAWAYAKTGNSAKAVEILTPIVEKAPKIAVFRYHLGYALYDLGDKAAAKSHLEIASSSNQVFPGKDNAKKLLKTL